MKNCLIFEWMWQPNEARLTFDHTCKSAELHFGQSDFLQLALTKGSLISERLLLWLKSSKKRCQITALSIFSLVV